MTQDPVLIHLTPELQRLADEVRKTGQPRTIDMGDNVVAIIRPAFAVKPQRASRNKAGDAAISNTTEKYTTVASLAGAAGTLPSPHTWQEIRETAREEHLAAKFGAHRS